MKTPESHETPRPRLVVIVGTNASGKSDLGVQIAKRFNGEVVSADSRQVYRGLDIGTGKLAAGEMEGVPHHLLDVVEVGEPFSLADYQRLAYAAIDGILRRRRLPLLVGGTGLYVRAVVDGYELVEVPPDQDLRTQFERLPVEELARRLESLNPQFAATVDLRNKRRVVRALEVAGAVAGDGAFRRRQPRYDALQLGVTWPRDMLYHRIDRRLAVRLQAGLLVEVQGLLDRGVPPAVLDRLGLEYRYVLRYLKGEYRTESELYERLKGAIHAFARRQLTWFRKDSRILWLDTSGDYLREAEERVREFIEAT